MELTFGTADTSANVAFEIAFKAELFMVKMFLANRYMILNSFY